MPASSRTIRVFLSSTFRDFAEERDLLVRKVFPELRRKCRERQVELVDVDLRWGITEKEAQQGKVLPICLAEVDRSRPWFMGFIGERYGWVPTPEQFDPAIVQEQPWLEEHRGGKSVTELEILHGVLNNPKMAGRAFFYFRDSKWSKKKGVAYLSEGTEEKAKLEGLKERIRQSGFPVQENYPSPEALAERVKEDLWKLIDEAYPESEVPDALTRERMTHEAYAATRCRLYLGGERYFVALDDAMKAKSFRPVLITGQSGGGKSALLANWVKRWSPKHAKTAVIMHHLGSGSDAADPVRMAVRLMREISRLTGDEFKPENDPEKLLELLPQWLALASAWGQRSKKELLIVLDGLDKLSERKHLRWFPGFLPPKVKLVASCLHGEILEAAKGRLDWQELKVKPFTKTEQRNFIGEYLGRYRKALTARQMKTLQSHPLSSNPLFLLTVLEELRVFGVHEELEHRMRTLLSPPPSKSEGEAPTVDDVFEHVLARIEKDLGKKAVQQAMEAIWASRAGLYQDELLAIAKLAPAKWAAIQNALDESIYESSGKISFGNDYLRKAVEGRYGLTGKKKLGLHRRLAEWFGLTSNFFAERYTQPNYRKGYELPYQLIAARDASNLDRVLTDAEFLMSCCGSGQLLDLLLHFHQASVLTGAPEFVEWHDFLRKHAFLIEANLSSISPHIAFLQLALESGNQHPMKYVCRALLRKNTPKAPIYVSLVALRRQSYKRAIEVVNVYQADGAGVLLGDVVVINQEHFASFGEVHELWHVSEGQKACLDSGGPSGFCYSKQALSRLIKQAQIKNLECRRCDFERIERDLQARKKEFLPLNSNYSVHWKNPEFGSRYIEFKDMDGNTTQTFHAHDDAVCGAVLLGTNRFLSWGWDGRIVIWEWNQLGISDVVSTEGVLHTEQPNRWLCDEEARRLLVWTYRPSMDDLGYEEDKCVSMWDYSSGELKQEFRVTPYVSEVKVYADKLQLNSSWFGLKAISRTGRDAPSGRLIGHYTESENTIALNNRDKSTSLNRSVRTGKSTEPFAGYAHVSSLTLLTEVDGVFALAARTGEVVFVKRGTDQE